MEKKEKGKILRLALSAAGVLSIFYGASCFLIGTGTFFFISWFVLGAALLALSAALKRGWLKKIPRPVRRLFCAAAGVVFALFLYTEGLILGHFFDAGPPALDALIVLGAQIRPDGPSLSLQYRLDTAAAYLGNNPETICIVTGAKGPLEPVTEASGMREYLLSLGIADERIRVDDTSRDTKENIRNSMAFLAPEHARVGIVTNNFHVFRGISIARKAGIREVYGLASPMHPWFLPNNMVRECLAVWKDLLSGNL